MTRRNGACKKPPGDIYFRETHRQESPLVVTGSHGRTFVTHSLFSGQEFESWPSQTDVACFHDGEQFDTVPVFGPVDYDPVRGVYTGMGVFCSGSCRAAFLQERPSHKNAFMMMLLGNMLRDVFGSDGNIIAAPPRHSLQKFGGPYTLQEFRAKCVMYRVVAHTAPMITSAMTFEERPVDEEGEEQHPEAAAPVSALADSSGRQWNVRGLRIPKDQRKQTAFTESAVAGAAPTKYATKGAFDSFVEEMRDAVPEDHSGVNSSACDNEFSEEVRPAKRAKTTARTRAPQRAAKTTLSTFMRKKES